MSIFCNLTIPICYHLHLKSNKCILCVGWNCFHLFFSGKHSSILSMFQISPSPTDVSHDETDSMQACIDDDDDFGDDDFGIDELQVSFHLGFVLLI